jgi:hypothetical protein
MVLSDTFLPFLPYYIPYQPMEPNNARAACCRAIPVPVHSSRKRGNTSGRSPSGNAPVGMPQWECPTGT